MEKIRFTVIICTYNRATYLQQCLEALARQTLNAAQYRIVVIDNNSKDNTRQVVQVYQQHLLNLSYYFEGQQGLSHARNRGIQESDSNYLFFLDDDALLSHDSLTCLENYLASHPDTLIVGGRAVIKYLNGKPNWVTPKVESWMGSYDYGDETLAINTMTLRQKQVRLPIGCCFIVKRSLLEEMGGFNPTVGRMGEKMFAGEETLIALKALDSSGTLVYLPNVYVDHMIEPTWVDPQFMLNKTWCYGISDWKVQRLSHKGLLYVSRYLIFRLLFLFKNLLDLVRFMLAGHLQNAYETRLLLNFHLGIFSGLFSDVGSIISLSFPVSSLQTRRMKPEEEPV
jgi:glycosyltransferase involved in cell wall biosynthesis